MKCQLVCDNSFWQLRVSQHFITIVMSSFGGLFDEIFGISADRFDGENLQSKVFFLSHCHADHMVGLDNPNGLPGPLYTSAVSKVLLQKWKSNLKDIRALEIECPEEICYEVDGKELKIVVTALPARHCPGSVMFLIQSFDQNILYTGDFRLTKQDLEKHSAFSILRKFPPNAVYLDTTFLDKSYMDFPSQIESIKAICNLISEWISKNPKNRVTIKTPADYGSEFLFMEIYRKLKQQIYVQERKSNNYVYFPEMDECISFDRDKCRIEHCLKNTRSFMRSREDLVIVVTAMIWKNWKIGDSICCGYENNKRVAYSAHSSYREIKEFIEYLKPKKVKGNVIPHGKDMEYVQESLDQILREFENPKGFENRKEIEKQSSIGCRFSNLFRPPRCEIRVKNEDEVPLRMPIKRIKM